MLIFGPVKKMGSLRNRHMRYVALLRGVNVGGNNKVSMAELVTAMTADGFGNVKSYINSGNVLFDAEEPEGLAQKVADTIKKHFELDIEVVVFDRDHWQQIIDEAPDNWGQDPEWKHNLLIMIPPYIMNKVIREIGSLKPGIETLVPGRGVLYQSMSRELFGKTTTGKLASSPVYKKMTVRNYNTAIKLFELLSTDE